MIDDSTLHAYLDGELDPATRAEVEARLAQDPEARQRLENYAGVDRLLRQEYAPVLDEPVPARLLRRPARMPVRRLAGLAATLVGGVALGWVVHGELAPTVPQLAQASMPVWRQAVAAHVVYTPEVRHPVEVTAEQEQHLVGWLSKRLGTPVRAPRLSPLGYELLGGRLLPDEGAPAAQFMYQDASGRRLTLYVKRNTESRDTAFRFASDSGQSAFYWVDRELGYALVGDLPRGQLSGAARLVYQQLTDL